MNAADLSHHGLPVPAGGDATRRRDLRPIPLNAHLVTLLPVCRQLFGNSGTQGFGSIPMRSLTADRIRCLQPRYRSVV